MKNFTEFRKINKTNESIAYSGTLDIRDASKKYHREVIQLFNDFANRYASNTSEADKMKNDLEGIFFAGFNCAQENF